MYQRFNTYTLTRPRLRKIVGWTLLVIGFVALVTPLTPGGLLFFVGLELLGFRYIFGKKWSRFFTPAVQKVTPDKTEQSL
jgi:uncharacterized protein YqgC (DUF456 family)